MASSKQAEKEHENFSRYSRLLLDVAPKVLRKLLETHALKKASTLDDFFTDINVKLQLERTRVLRRPQLDLIYPEEKACGNIEDWDITLICAILKSTCSLSSEDWDKVEKIRKIRNETYGHVKEASLSDKDFHENWSDLSSTIVDIGKATNDDAFLNDISNSVSLIEQGVHAEIVKTWQKDEDQFVETRANSQVQQILQKNNIVTITGVSGSGKSGIAHHAALLFGKQGYTIYPVTQADNIMMYSDLKKRQVFVLDDPVGKLEVDWNELQQFEKLHQHFLAIIKGDVKIILTCRKNILNDERLMSYETLVGMGLVDLSTAANQLTESEKRQMFEKYAKKTKLSESQKDMIIKKTYMKFPLLCKVFGTNLHKYENQSTKFFSEPFSVLLEELATIKRREKYQYCALLLCLIYQNSFDIDCLNNFSELFQHSKEKIFTIMYVCGLSKDEPLDKIKNAFKSLVDVYFIQEESRFRFIHDALFDVVAYQFGTDFPCEMLKYCSSKFIREHVRTENAHTDDNLAIRMKKKHYTELTKRLYSDLIQGNFHDVFLNPSMHDESFVDAFCSHTRSMEREDLVMTYFQTCPNLERYESACAVSEPRWDKYWFIQSMLQDKSTRGIHWLMAYNYFEIFSTCHSVLKDFTAVPIYNKGADELPQSDSNTHHQQGAEMNLLPMACLSGNVKMLETVQQNDPNADIKVQWSGWRFYILHLAAISGQIEMVEAVIRMGIHVDCYAYGTPLFIAAGLDNSHLCEYLLNKGANVNRCRSDGSSPLWQAAVLGHTNTVSVLLRHKANVNLCYRDGASPLFVAARKGHTETVSVLLEGHACPNVCRIDGVSPLYIAAIKGHTDVISLLLNHRAGADLTDIDNMSPLFVAAQHGNKQIVDLLLQKRASPNLCDRNGTSPLLIAARQGHAETVSTLLKNDAKINLCRFDGASPLFIAARGGWTKIVSLLLEHNADINLCQNNSISPLHAAAMEGHDDVVSLLLPHYKNVNITTRDHHTPLYMACQAGSLKCVALLLQAGADVNMKGSGCSPLTEARQAGHDDIVEALISAGADKNTQMIDSESLPDTQGNIAEDVMETPTKFDKFSPFKQEFLARNRNNAVPKAEHTYADDVYTNDKKAKRRDIFPNIEAKVKYTDAADAVETNIKRIDDVDTEVRTDASLNKQANDTELTAPIKVMEAEHEQFVKKTTDVVTDTNITAEGAEHSALIEAIKSGTADDVDALIRAGMDINTDPNDTGRLPLAEAIRAGNVGVVEALIKTGANVEERSPYTGYRPLMEAVLSGRTDIVKALVNAGAEVNIPSIYNGRCPLLEAAKTGYPDIVDILVSARADLDIKSKNTGAYPLIEAAIFRRADVVEKLACAGAQINIVNGYTKRSALMEAAMFGHTDVVKTLIRNGADVKMKHIYTKRTALAEAVKAGHDDIVRALKTAGAHEY